MLVVVRVEDLVEPRVSLLLVQELDQLRDGDLVAVAAGAAKGNREVVKRRDVKKNGRFVLRPLLLPPLLRFFRWS